MKIPDPNKKTKVLTTVKEQPLSTTTPPPTVVGKSKPYGDVESMVDDGIPEGLVCNPFIRVSSPRTSDGVSEKRQEELIREAASKLNWSID